MKSTFLSFVICLAPLFSFSCDRSSLSLISIASGPGGTFVISMDLCFGQGILGTLFGADGGTRDFAFRNLRFAPHKRRRDENNAPLRASRLENTRFIKFFQALIQSGTFFQSFRQNGYKSVACCSLEEPLYPCNPRF